jgi:hypothetical protein
MNYSLPGHNPERGVAANTTHGYAGLMPVPKKQGLRWKDPTIDLGPIEAELKRENRSIVADSYRPRPNHRLGWVVSSQIPSTHRNTTG